MRSEIWQAEMDRGVAEARRRGGAERLEKANHKGHAGTTKDCFGSYKSDQGIKLVQWPHGTFRRRQAAPVRSRAKSTADQEILGPRCAPKKMRDRAVPLDSAVAAAGVVPCASLARRRNIHRRRRAASDASLSSPAVAAAAWPPARQKWVGDSPAQTAPASPARAPARA